MLCVAAVFLLVPIANAASSVSWNGTLVDSLGKPVAQAVIKLHPSASGRDHTATTAADGKFVLSGGQPTLTDASSDTTTGHSLTFFVANDTILIDSQEGSRTLTKHRVEK